jgi:GT2 family glycosyltransferase
VSSSLRSANVLRPAWLCRVGKRVLVACTGSNAVEALAEHAARQMEFTAGGEQFALLQMPAGEDLSDIDSQSGTIEVAKDLGSFLAGALAPSAHGLFLKRLFGIARMFQLGSDPLFAEIARTLRATSDLRKARIALDVVEGLDTAIATVPARAGIAASDLLIEIGETVEIGTVEHVTRFLARDDDRQKLAAARLSAVPTGSDYLLIGDKGLTLVEATVRSQPSVEKFHAEYAHKNPDLVALLALADDETGLLLDRLSRRNDNGAVVDEPFYNLHFELVTSVPLEHGLFLSGWYLDPDDLVEAVTAIDPGLEGQDVMDSWISFDGRADLGSGEKQIKRFVAFLPRKPETRMPLAPPAVRITLSTGESHIASAELGTQDLIGKRKLIVDSIAGHAFDLETLETIYAPALEALHADINARQSVSETRLYGTRSKQKVSLIIPLYRETAFIRSQLMAFSADPFIRENCEIVYVLDDPLIALDVAGILEGSAIIYPLDVKLVMLAVNGGYALANNFGVDEAAGEMLVLMNSDVIPVGEGWLEPALQQLGGLSPFSVIGPKLLYADGTLQHAGMYFYRLSNSQWQNMHYWKGYGSDFAAANVERTVPAVTGACMLIRKADYQAVGGFTSDYIIGDFEDSDLCLKLRDKGGVSLYMPSISLYHFERQSMPKDLGQLISGTAAYNQALHTARWSSQIDEIVADSVSA